MNSQMIHVERREHPRVGVMAQLEDITFSVLRKQRVSTPTHTRRQSAKAGLDAMRLPRQQISQMTFASH